LTDDARRTKPHSLPLFILGGMLFLASAYFYQDPEWNGNSRLDLTRAIVEQGTLTIDQYQAQPPWDTGDKALFGDHYYSDKAIGSSLIAVPFYFILYKASAALAIVLTSAFVKHALTTAVLGTAFTVNGLSMYWIAQRITGDAWKALIPTLGLSFGTMLWPYSAVFYGHVLAAAFLAVAFCILFSWNDAPARAPRLGLFAAGAAMGLAVASEYTAAIVIAGLILYAMYVLRRTGLPQILGAGAIGALGALIPLAFVMLYNYRVYGTPLTTGYAYEVEDKFVQGMSTGLLGVHAPNLSAVYHITLDPQFGILWQSPILLLAPLGFWVAWRTPRYRAVGLLSLFAALAMLAMNGGYYLWWGGSAFGPRLMIPALPFLIAPLALVPNGLLWLTGLLGLVSSAQMLIPLVGQIQFTRLTFRPRRGMFYVADTPFTGFSLLYEYGLQQIWRQYAEGRPAWTLGFALGLPYWLSIPALVAVESALLAWFRRVVAKKETDCKGAGGVSDPAVFHTPAAPSSPAQL
jgi:hypothetical protein